MPDRQESHWRGGNNKVFENHTAKIHPQSIQIQRKIRPALVLFYIRREGRLTLYESCIWTLRAAQGPNGILRPKTLQKLISWAKFAVHEFHQKSDFWWNLVNSKSGSRNQFPEGFRPQNPVGSLRCAQCSKFRRHHAWCSTMACRDGIPYLSNIFLAAVVIFENHGW